MSAIPLGGPGLGGKELLGERAQEQPGKGEPGGEHELRARQGTQGGPRRDAGRGKAPCLAGPGGHEANASVLGRAAGSRAGAWGRQPIAQKKQT